jgi:hypothetical protein
VNHFSIVVSVSESSQLQSCYFNRGSKKVLGVLTSKYQILLRVIVTIQKKQTHSDSATVSTVLVSSYIEKKNLNWNEYPPLHVYQHVDMF